MAENEERKKAIPFTSAQDRDEKYPFAVIDGVYYDVKTLNAQRDAIKHEMSTLYDMLTDGNPDKLSRAAPAVTPSMLSEFLDCELNGYRVMLIMARYHASKGNFELSEKFLRPLLRLDLSEDVYGEESGVAPYKLMAQKTFLSNLAAQGKIAGATVMYDSAVKEYEALKMPEAMATIADFFDTLKKGAKE